MGKRKREKTCVTPVTGLSTTHINIERAHTEKKIQKKNIFIFVLFSKEGRRREKKRC